MKQRLSHMQQKARRFWRAEDGNQTIEVVIWLPIFLLISALIVNVALIYLDQSRMLRVAQDANRAFSVGWLVSEDAVESYVADNLADLAANLTVNAAVSNGVITTDLSIPATALMPLTFPGGAFDSTTISITAQQYVEF